MMAQRRLLLIALAVLLVLAFINFHYGNQLTSRIPFSYDATPNPESEFPATVQFENPHRVHEVPLVAPQATSSTSSTSSQRTWSSSSSPVMAHVTSSVASSSSSSAAQSSSATRTQASSTSSVQPATAIPQQLQQTVINYTDPLNISRTLYYGPWRAEIPTQVLAGEPFKMTFRCLFPEHFLCPSYFLVLFHGPTRQTVPPDNFRPLNSTPPLTYGSLEAEWTIMDEGDYTVYSYPDFVYNWKSKLMFCRKWNEEMEWPWHKASVQGAPWNITVKPNPAKKIEEGWKKCPATDISLRADGGRYVATDPNISLSPQFSDYYGNTNRTFIWSPYTCKIPHRTIREIVAQVPSLKQILVIGDSISRAFYCIKIWEDVHGTTKDTVCDYIAHNQTYWDQNVGHKFTWKLFDDGNRHKRNVSFTFTWSPTWWHNKAANPVILGLDPPPTHIIWTVGRWCAWDDMDILRKTYIQFLEFIKDNFTGVVQHITIRSSATGILAIKCTGDKPWIYENKWKQGPPEDSMEFRIGTSKKRRLLYEVAKEWNKKHENNMPFKLSVVDAFAMTDARPESTSDGTHWVEENEKSYLIRPTVGECEGIPPAHGTR